MSKKTVQLFISKEYDMIIYQNQPSNWMLESNYSEPISIYLIACDGLYLESIKGLYFGESGGHLALGGLKSSGTSGKSFSKGVWDKK